jgi:3-oxoacyl-[acyl-carrier protein] reductase
MSNPMSLDQRTVVITGAGQGIGLAIGKLIIELGGNVLGVDINAQALETAKESLPAGRFTPVVGSVADPAVAQKAVESAVAAYGTVSGLVNNAGVTRPAMIDKMSAANWQ